LAWDRGGLELPAVPHRPPSAHLRRIGFVSISQRVRTRPSPTFSPPATGEAVATLAGPDPLAPDARLCHPPEVADPDGRARDAHHDDRGGDRWQHDGVRSERLDSPQLSGRCSCKTKSSPGFRAHQEARDSNFDILNESTENGPSLEPPSSLTAPWSRISNALKSLVSGLAIFSHSWFLKPQEHVQVGFDDQV